MTINYIEVTAVKAAMDAGRGMIVIDGRTPEEYAAGHVSGSVNIPIPDLAAAKASIAEDPSRLIVTTCGSTGRGEKASDILSECGVEGVVVLEGGLKAWREAGYDVGVVG